MRTSGLLLGGGLLLLVGLAVACEESVGLQTETHRIEAEGARTAEIELRMGAGELILGGADGQEALMEGTFLYNRRRLKPEVDYHVFNDKGVLRIGHERSGSIVFGRTRNEWDIRLNKSVSLDLKVKLGAGRGDLDLRGLDLTDLDVDMGVGEMILDLRGPHRRSIDVRIEGGIGSGLVHLPSKIGVRVKVDGGLGSVHARGLLKKGDVYTNDAYGKSEIEIEIDVDAGIGSLDLRVDDAGVTRI